MNKVAISLMLSIGIFLYFAIVASMISVKINPDNVANQLAYGQDEFDKDVDQFCEWVAKSGITDKDTVECFLRFNTNDTLDFTQDASKFNWTVPN